MPASPPIPSLQALHVLRRLALFPTRSTSITDLRRQYHTTPSQRLNAASPPAKVRNKHNRFAPTHHSRGPASTESTALSDFSSLDIFSNSSTPLPAISIDATTPFGFHLSNGVKTENKSGLLLLAGEAFVWDPTASPTREGSLLSKKGTLTIPASSLELLRHMHPRPDLLIVGTGKQLWMLSKETREFFAKEVGVRVEVLDTANASASYNLLATERGLGEGGVGAVLFCGSWAG